MEGEHLAQAAYLACRKSVVNIPWISSMLTPEDKAKTPNNAGVCKESTFRTWAEEYYEQGKTALVCYGVQTYLRPRQQKQNVGEL